MSSRTNSPKLQRNPVSNTTNKQTKNICVYMSCLAALRRATIGRQGSKTISESPKSPHKEEILYASVTRKHGSRWNANNSGPGQPEAPSMCFPIPSSLFFETWKIHSLCHFQDSFLGPPVPHTTPHKRIRVQAASMATRSKS